MCVWWLICAHSYKNINIHVVEHQLRFLLKLKPNTHYYFKKKFIKTMLQTKEGKSNLIVEKDSLHSHENQVI